MKQFHGRAKTDRDASPGERVLLGWHDRISDALAAVSPPLAFYYGSAMGRLLSHLRLYGAIPLEVEMLFGAMPFRRRLAIAQAISAAQWMNRVASRLVQHAGYDEFNRAVLCRSDGQLARLHSQRHPAILGFMHSGPLLAISATLHRLDIPALVITWTRHHQGKTSLEVRRICGTEASHRSVLKRAVDKLRGGGIVLWSLDSPGKARLRVQFFGRERVFARGPFAAARLTGARLIPITAEWAGAGHMEVRVGEPLHPSRQSSRPSDHSREEALAIDNAIAAEAAAWFEGYFRGCPERMSLDMLRRLLHL
jgi:lauroyl/myristoyl acyltransferase